MTDTVTVSVEIPVDDLRRLHKQISDTHRAVLQQWGTNLDVFDRVSDRLVLAALDTPLPPEPIKVGDRVRTISFRKATVLAICDDHAWIEYEQRIDPDAEHALNTVALTDLTRVEG